MNLFQKIKQVDWKDVGKRTLKTFIEAFLSVLTFDSLIYNFIEGGGNERKILVTTGISALAAGITAVWNMISSYISENIIEAVDKIGTKEEATDEVTEEPLTEETITEEPIVEEENNIENKEEG